MDATTVITLITGIIISLISHTGGKVFELDHKNFDDVVNDDLFAVVMFYAPWCGACKQALPRFAEASSKFGKEKDVVFARVNAFEDRILSLKFNIDRFPTTFLFPYNPGEAVKYEDVLSVDKITKTVKDLWKKENKKSNKKRVKKPKITKPITTVDPHPETGVIEMGIEHFYNTVLDPTRHAWVLFYAPGCTKDCGAYDEISTAFVNEDSVVFTKLDVTTDIKIAQNFNVIKNPTLYWFPINDKDMGSRYGGDMDVKELVEFTNDNTGTARSVSGELLPAAGRVRELDKMIKRNIEDIVNARNMEIIMTEAKTLTMSSVHGKKYLNYYIKLLMNIEHTKDADSVIQNEYDDINDKLAAARTKKESDELVKLRNILGVFVDYAAEVILDMPTLEEEFSHIRDEL